MVEKLIKAAGETYKLDIVHPRDVSPGGWAGAQHVLHTAFSDGLHGRRSQAQIDEIAQVGNLDAFRSRRLDLREAQRTGDLHVAQSYTRPSVALVEDVEGTIMGYGYVANNVSGKTKLERGVKRLQAAKNYRWIKEIAVLPEYQHLGIGRTILRNLVDAPGLKQEQTVTAYVWDYNQSGLDFFKAAGFKHPGFLVDNSLFHGIPAQPDLLRHTQNSEALIESLSHAEPTVAETVVRS